jgi:hypothetical protein
LADLANRVGPAAAAQPGFAPGAAVGAPAQPVHPPAPGGPSLPATDLETSAGSTGHPQVDAALAALDRAGSLSPQEQIAAYESVHRTLQETLRSIEQS